jgi:hypothetical protein
MMHLKTTIHLMVGIERTTLVVFYTFKGYQFDIIDSSGFVHQPQLIFPTLEAAERQGRNWIQARFCF